MCKTQIRVALYYTGEFELARCTPPYNDGVAVHPHQTQGVVLRGKLSVHESRAKLMGIMFDRRRKDDNVRRYTFRYKNYSIIIRTYTYIFEYIVHTNTCVCIFMYVYVYLIQYNRI